MKDQKILKRLKIVEGQVRGLQKMIEKNEYCMDIINQTLAIKNALSNVEDLILEKHLRTCASEQIKSGKKSKTVKEILSIYKLSKRK